MADPTPEPEVVTPEPTPPTPDPTPEPEPFDQERAMRTIHSQREAEKELKAQLAEARKAEQELEEIKRNQLSETERLKAERDDALAKAQAREERIRTANLRVAISSAEIPAVDVDAVAVLLANNVQYDDDGTPTNFEEAYEALLESKPALRKVEAAPQPPNLNGPAGSGAQPTVALNADELAAAQEAGMEPEKFKFLQGKDSGIVTIDDYQSWAARQGQ